MSANCSGAEAPARLLRPGIIFEIARGAGFLVHVKGDKAAIRCPFHDDRSASAVLFVRNIFYCCVCTPKSGMGAKRFAERLSRPWDDYVRQQAPPQSRPTRTSSLPEFTPSDAARTLAIALARAQDDACVDADRDVYEYLRTRGLIPARELRMFGILAEQRDLHATISGWPWRGYRIIAPLFDLTAQVVNLQARGVGNFTPKTRVPAGSRVRGLVFADARGLRVLSGDAAAADIVVLGEGLTDMLALSFASPFPVLTAPGTSNAPAAVGPWARSKRVLLALDNDDAGRQALEPTTRALREHGAQSVLRVEWPDGCKDACDALRALGESGLRELLAAVGRRSR